MSAINLRPYQTEAVQAIYDYFANQGGNPLIVLPTGAGKSLTLAAFIKGAIEAYPATRIIVLTHVKAQRDELLACSEVFDDAINAKVSGGGAFPPSA